MSLRKSATLTPALLAANRRNAQKSMGPRTPRGKAWSRLNRLKHGMRSREYLDFVNSLAYAEPCQVEAAAEAYFRTHDVIHPIYWEIADILIQAEIQTRADFAVMMAPWSNRE